MSQGFQFERKIDLEGRVIEEGSDPFLIAELSGNHQQSLNQAKDLIDAAAESGADAVKLQTYTPDTITLSEKNDFFRIKEGLWKGRYLYELYQEAMTPWEWTEELFEYAQKRGLLLFSTPFDETAVDFLEKSIDPVIHKVSSFEITHLPLLKKIGETKKPVLMSTGMALKEEIKKALEVLQKSGCPAVILLKCISQYPADPRDFNLKSLPLMAEEFGTLVGLSDHCLSEEVVLGAVALGAVCVEKHLVLSRELGGVDSGFSLEPKEFAHMAKSVRSLHASLGKPCLGATVQEEKQLHFRRSIFVSSPVGEGEILSYQNLKVVRPSVGLMPSEWETVLGKRATRDLKAGEPLRIDMFQ